MIIAFARESARMRPCATISINNDTLGYSYVQKLHDSEMLIGYS